MSELQRLAITCGGTGGHFYPGLATAIAAEKRGIPVLLLLSGVNAAKQCAVAAEHDLRAVELPRMPSPSSFRTLWGFGFGALCGFFRSCRELRRFRPQAVLGMGSFASAPVLAAARMCRIPRFLHDGNARIGRANRIFSSRNGVVAAAFPVVNADACRGRIVVTGMPLRAELVAAAAEWDKAKAIARLNERFGTSLSPECFTILVTGGSQGAATLNEVVPRVLAEADSSALQVLHLAGRGKAEAARAAYGDSPIRRIVIESTAEMELFLAAADLAFSRSGGSTVAELALFGTPAVLVPYPYAAEGHQRDNALFFTGRGGGILIDNAALTPEAVRDVLARPKEFWEEASRRARELARPRAAEALLDEIGAMVRGESADRI